VKQAEAEAEAEAEERELARPLGLSALQKKGRIRRERVGAVHFAYELVDGVGRF